MTEIIFWNTAAFIALNNKDDSLHPAAINVSKELARAQTHTLTTDAVLIEITNTFSRVTMRPIASHVIGALLELADRDLATIVHIDSTLWQ